MQDTPIIPIKLTSELHMRELAKSAVEVATTNGFLPVTWQTLPTKLMMIVTELDELKHSKSVGPELADVCLRTMGVLHVLFPGWSLRVYHGPHFDPHMMKALECELWPVVHQCTLATQAWRRSNQAAVQSAIELIVTECYRLSDILRVDLVQECELKIAYNRLRPHLHGSAEPLG